MENDRHVTRQRPRILPESGLQYGDYTAIADQFGVTLSHVRQCAMGIRKGQKPLMRAIASRRRAAFKALGALDDRGAA